MLEQACHQLREWHLDGPVGPQSSVEVNLSARQIDDPEIVRTVEAILARTGLLPEHLTLEITESALMRDAASALVVLSALKELGVLLAIDDFGTGYSSLSYLQRFPLDIVKVDRMFVEELGMRTGGDEIVAAVVQLAHALGLHVVAEGVETDQQLDVLRSLECDFAQGFLFSATGTGERAAVTARSSAGRFRLVPCLRRPIGAMRVPLGTTRHLDGTTVVGTTGFEPATSCSQSRRATKLRYVPLAPGGACRPVPHPPA